MLMARENPDPLVAPLSDLDESGPQSHPLHSPNQYHPQHQGYQGSVPGQYAQHQHASAAQYQYRPQYSADIFSGSPPRGLPSQATMYAAQDGMPHGIQEAHLPAGGGAPMGMSRFHGVTYNKGKWQASVFCQGRWVYCETFDTEVAAAAAYDRALRHCRPQDAELYVNFKQNISMPQQQAPMPGVAYQTYWDGGEGTDDGQSGVSGTEGRAWVNHAQQRTAAGGMVPQRVSSSNYPGMMAAGVNVIPSSMAPAPISEDGTSTGFRGGGMVKSASVSTLLAQTTLSDSSAVPVSAMDAPMMQWPPGVQVPNVASGGYDPNMQVMAHGGQAEFPDISAASLLLGAEGGPPPAAQNPRIAPAGMKRVASAVDSSAMRTMHVRSPRGAAKYGAVGSPHADPASNSAGTGGSGGPAGSGGSGSGHAHACLGVAEGGVRRVGSAQELASSVNKPAGGVRQAALSARSTRAAATRASNRRANSRYAKDKREEGERASTKAFCKEGAGPAAAAAAAKAAGADKRPKSEEEVQAERVRVYQALLAGQERLHDQMRAHQAQHEEQQRRAAQREADKATEARRKEAPPATGSPQAASAAAAPQSAAPMLSAQVQVSPQGQNSTENDMAYAGNSRRRAGSRASPPYPPTSEGSTGSGGKVPRRIPSEPHSLAALGVAGMGGRHSPTVTRAMSGMGMRRVKSTHNFGHHQQQQQYMPMQHMQMSMAMPTEMLRASPSMPVFPTTVDPAPATRRLDSLDSGQPLPNITEEREDPLKLPECVTSMFLDEPEQGNDDLLSLMKDLTDQGANNGLDLDWVMPLEGEPAGPRANDSRSHAENMPQSNLHRKVGPNGAGAPAGQANEQPATAQAASDLDPAFFHVEGADQIGMGMLDEVGVDDFSSPYLDL